MRDEGTLTLALEMSTREEGRWMNVLIEDTGPGIPPDLLKVVFEPFFTTKRSSGGRGVGLTLSRAMVERHGGLMAIESPILSGGGTRVKIVLPMAK
jgi:two-component system sensor histidine kinase PhcS